MEAPTWLVYAATWLIALAIFSFFTFFSSPFRSWRPNLPPGPKPWPIIGNLNLIGTLPHRSLYQLSQKYGPLMTLQFGCFPVVVGSSAELAKSFFKTHDHIFATRPETAAGKYTTYDYTDITWAPYGPYWRHTRKVCLVELFNAKRLDSHEGIRVEERVSLINRLYHYASSHKEIYLRDHLSTANLKVMSRMVLGKNYFDEAAPERWIVSPEEFKKMLEELFLLNGVMNVGDWIPWMGFLDLQGYVKRMKVLSKKFDLFLDHVIDEHKAKTEDQVVDLVDVLLKLVDDDSGFEVKLNNNGIKGIIQDIVAGGTESSAVTVEWTMSELLRKPEIFENAIKELDRVIGRDRWVEEKDIAQLPYIQAIVKETMRLHPLAPLLAPRLALDDCQIAGYDIPKGTRIIVNIWTIAKDPELWDKPNEFCPERFIGKAIDVKGQHFELLPFGSGRRMCLGYSLGLKMIQSSLANILHGFNWKLPGKMKPEDLDMEEIFGLSAPRKNPLVAIAMPRLPDHVYSLHN